MCTSSGIQDGQPKKRGCCGFGCCLAVLLLLAGVCLTVCGIAAVVFLSGDSEDFSTSFDEGGSLNCGKVAVIEINGIIMSGVYGEYSGTCSADTVIRSLEKAAKDGKTKAIIISLNTPGGEVTAADDIYQTVRRIRKKYGKPVIALMNSMAASGGYYVAVGCDRIMASRLTMTGSIGVIVSGWNVSGLMNKIGVASEVYKSGKMKDMLSPTRSRTPEEIRLVQNMVDETYDIFVRIVAEGRGKQISDIRGTELGDGRVFSGNTALKHKMIDEIGRFPDAVLLAEKMAGVSPGSLRVERYRRNTPLMEMLLGSRAGRVQIDLPGTGCLRSLPPLQQGAMYFLPPAWF